MKKTLLLLSTALAVSALLTACGQTVPYVNTNTEEECVTINKNLFKIDEFTTTVEKTSPFHLEEAAIALGNPKVTSSNNKRQMLRDAAQKKAKLEAEHQKLGCDVVTK